jgi:hypothetical protein
MSAPIYGRMNSLGYEMQRGIKGEGARTGTYVFHTPAVGCSCITDSGQATPSCRVCGGSGFFYPANLERKRQAIVSQAVNQREFIMGPGIIERDDIVVSFM